MHGFFDPSNPNPHILMLGLKLDESVNLRYLEDSLDCLQYH